MVPVSRRHLAAIVVTLISLSAMLLSACSSPAGAAAAHTATSTATATSTSTSAGAGGINLQALPLGDGHVGSTPQVGWVDACNTSFPSRGGASQDGPWIHGTTWDATAKIAVQGAVSWPQGAYSVQLVGGQRVIQTNDVPKSFPTGVFPIAPTDPAWAYDRNPNTIRPQSIQYTLPAQPTVASAPSCLGMGPIGVLADGVVLFNALDAEGRDAAAHEVLDSCGGHPQMNGEYHHHDIPPCLLATAKGPSTLVGYARDGFGIYVERDAQGNLLTNSSLDVCHGRTSVVTWDGKQVNMYHYVATAEYPYTLGCYMGAPVTGGGFGG